MNGAMDTAYVYGASAGAGSGRLSLNRFDGSTGYYLYDPRGSVTGITNEDGQVYQSYRYSAFGEVTFGAPRYENEYTYNGESYNPNIHCQYLRARYYDVVKAAFVTEDFYPQDMWALWNVKEPLTLNRYSYCAGNPVNYVDKNGHWVENDIAKATLDDPSIPKEDMAATINMRVQFYQALRTLGRRNATFDYVMHYNYAEDEAFYKSIILEAKELSELQYVGAEELKKIKPGTGRISPKGTELLISYEDLGENYKVYSNGELVAILSRDVEGEGNITYGYGILFRNTKEDRERLYRDYGLEFEEKVQVPIDICEKMYEDYINNNIEDFNDFLRNNHLWINQNQLDALIMHRHLVYRLGPETQEAIIDIFSKNDANNPALKELYWDKMYDAMLNDLKNGVSEDKYKTYENGWKNRITDELELFFDGDERRDH